jgi:hypothetical protein
MSMKEVVSNVVVKRSAWTERDIELLFGDLEGNVETVHFTEAQDLPNLLKELGIFPSTSEARRAGRGGPIPEGWTEMKASKKRMLWIWNPTE